MIPFIWHPVTPPRMNRQGLMHIPAMMHYPVMDGMASLTEAR